MSIEQQVCTAQQGKRLQELGVTTEALFNHCVFCPDPLGEKYYYEICYSGCTPTELELPGERVAPAYTVAELGEMLHIDYTVSERCQGSVIETKGRWICGNLIGMGEDIGDYDYHHCQFGATEAQARAAMLIYLLENNLIPKP